MTLNDVIAPILLYFTEFDSFAGLLRQSAWLKIDLYWPTLQRGLSATAELLVHKLPQHVT